MREGTGAGAQMAARHLLNRKTGLLANFRCGSRLCKNAEAEVGR